MNEIGSNDLPSLERYYPLFTLAHFCRITLCMFTCADHAVPGPCTDRVQLKRHC